MKRILVKKILVVAFLASLAGISWGAVFCVSTPTELQNALDVAAINGEDDIIKVCQGTYNGNFYFYSSEGYSITLLGGYTLNCADRVVNPSYTVLDGGGSGRVLDLDNSNGGDILIEGFTIQNGDGNYYGVGVRACSYSDIRAAGDVTLIKNIIKGNTSYIIIKGNTSYVNVCGGGVFARSGSDSDPTGNVTLTNNTITGNTSGGWAGGVYACTYSETGIAGDVILTNNIITGNTAYDYGGGVDVITNSASGTAGNIILTNNTITENIANSRGGGLSIYQPADRNSYVYNNIIWGNTAPEGGDIYFSPWGPGIPNGYNNDYSDMYGSWTNYGNNINEDPLFVGGDNCQLQDISPCIDAGDNFAPELPEFDFVGSLRIIDGDGDATAVVDMGAYEYVIDNLTIETSTGGTTDPSPGIYSHLGGTEVTVAALPDDNYRFSEWTGDVPTGHENDNPITITMDSAKNLIANFIHLEPEINIKYGTTEILDGESYDFGSQTVGTDTDVTFTIENTGTADLTLSGSPIITITWADADQFSVEQQPVSLVSPDNSTTFIIRFSPTSTDGKTAAISIANNDADENPYDITFTEPRVAQPPEPEINIPGIVDGGSYNFGSQTVGTDTDVTFTIENVGEADLTLSGSPIITITGADADHFSVEQQPVSPVSPRNPQPLSSGSVLLQWVERQRLYQLPTMILMRTRMILLYLGLERQFLSRRLIFLAW